MRYEGADAPWFLDAGLATAFTEAKLAPKYVRGNYSRLNQQPHLGEFNDVVGLF